jgi:hypothetical protein
MFIENFVFLAGCQLILNSNSYIKRTFSDIELHIKSQIKDSTQFFNYQKYIQSELWINELTFKSVLKDELTYSFNKIFYCHILIVGHFSFSYIQSHVLSFVLFHFFLFPSYSIYQTEYN